MTRSNGRAGGWLLVTIKTINVSGKKITLIELLTFIKNKRRGDFYLSSGFREITKADSNVIKMQ